MIKARIESIRRGEVPEGYKRTKAGILPVDWESNHLSQIAEKSKTKNREKRYTKILTNSANEGIISQTDYFDKQIANNDNIEGYYIVKNGDFVYNPRISVAAPCGPINCYHGEEIGVMSPLYTVFSIDMKEIQRDYIEQFFSSTSWHRYMKSVANYGVRSDRMNLSDEDFFLLPIPMPARVEQEKIAEILAGQDRVIALKEKLLAEKQRQKKYLMQQLLTGKKRLPGFSGEWKCVRLDELGCFYPGLSGKTKEDFGSGKPYIPYKNIFNNQKIDCDFFEYVKIKENETQTKVKYGDIFFTTSSEILSEVGMSSVMLDSVEELYLNSFCTGFRLNDFNSIHPEYAAHYFRGEVFRIALNKISQGITRFNLSKNGLSKISLTLPPIEEQLAIAQILSTADKEIELLKKDIEQEKLKKKSLMQLLLTGIVRVKDV